MPKVIPQIELDAILYLVAQFPDGAAVVDLASAADPPIARRTLQRRLEVLVDAGKLRKTGKGRATRYHSRQVVITGHMKAVATTTAGLTHRIGLSEEAELTRDSVSRPIAERHPVGYHRAFLDDYQPNVTSYLELDLREQLLSLGQAEAIQQPAGTYVRNIYERNLIDLNWNTSRLEGNTYSLLETQLLLEEGAAAAGKTVEETQMLLNHKEAIKMLVEQAEEVGVNRFTICNLHTLLSDNLMVDPAASGRIRNKAVSIGGSVYHPLEVPQLVEEQLTRLLDKANAIEDPFEQSFFLMVQLPYLQPFEDVNKRVSRLAANLPMIKQNICPLSFVDVPQEDYLRALIGVYELNRVDYLRDVYVWAYRRSCARYSAVRQSLGEPDPLRLRFRKDMARVISEVVLKGLDKQQATQHIRAYASAELAEEDRSRFVELVETDLLHLHLGNLARYRLRPSEFERWQETWNVGVAT
ncbi:MAG: Fic family protein [Halothiobacillus sp.]|jgi:fido (protein-threonine AMPylation protein)|nr:Fic family protein [Halothiobacillus sp.]